MSLTTLGNEVFPSKLFSGGLKRSEVKKQKLDSIIVNLLFDLYAFRIDRIVSRPTENLRGLSTIDVLDWMVVYENGYQHA